MTWDLEKVYDEQIAPLMAKVIAICKDHELPAFATFAYRKDDDEGVTSFCTTSLPFGDRQPPEMKRAAEAIYNREPRIVALTIQSGAPRSSSRGRR